MADENMKKPIIVLSLVIFALLLGITVNISINKHKPQNHLTFTACVIDSSSSESLVVFKESEVSERLCRINIIDGKSNTLIKALDGRTIEFNTIKNGDIIRVTVEKTIQYLGLPIYPQTIEIVVTAKENDSLLELGLAAYKKR